MTSGAVTGIVAGQSQTGILSQYALVFCGYTFMGIDAAMHGDVGKMIASACGLMATGRVVADNYKGSWYYRQSQKFAFFADKDPDETPAEKPERKNIFAQTVDAITAFPQKIVKTGAHAMQNSSHEKMKKFGDNLMEIADRPLFGGCLFGALGDTGYFISGLMKGDASQIFSGLCWYAAYAMSAVSTPKDGQENIFVTWLKSTRDAITGRKPPQPPQSGAVSQQPS